MIAHDTQVFRLQADHVYVNDAKMKPAKYETFMARGNEDHN